jgi:hypothetical protein
MHFGTIVMAQEYAPANLSVAEITRYSDRVSILRWQVIFVITLLCLWEGFPLISLGAAPIAGCQIYALIVLVGFAAYVSKWMYGKVKFTYWHLFASLLFGWCCFVSFCYSVLIFPQPWYQWVPSVFIVTPILTIFLLDAIHCEIGDVEDALLFTGAIGSGFVILDGLLGLHLLEGYVRGSPFSGFHVVFFKLESTFGLVIAVVRMVVSKSKLRQLFAAIACMLMAYNIVVLTESRLAMATVLISLVFVFLFVLKIKQKLIVAVLSPMALVPIAIFVWRTYFQNFSGLGNYLSEDRSTNFRNLEIDHFQYLFDQTFGVGFGFMSYNREYDNVLTYAAYKMGKVVGTGDVGMQVLDTGIWSAMYQFGYVGLVFAVVLVALSVFQMISMRRYSGYETTVAIGFAMAASMVSPISTNYYTIQFSAHIGALLFFIASRGKLERRRALL